MLRRVEKSKIGGIPFISRIYFKVFTISKPSDGKLRENMDRTGSGCMSLVLRKYKTQAKYGVFASYCTKDREKVLNILDIFRTLGLTVNDPEVDFIPGESVFRCILENGMDISKMTILFITKNFLMSSWCYYEANQAVWKYVTTRGKHRVIPLLLEHCKVPNFLKVLNCIHLWKYKTKTGTITFNGKTYSKGFVYRLMKALTAPPLKYRPIRWRGVKTFNRGTDLAKKARECIKRSRANQEEELSRWNPFQRWRLGNIIGHSILHCKYGSCTFSCSGRNFVSFEKHLETCRCFPLKCPNKKCGVICARSEMAKHLQDCGFAVIKCENRGCKFIGRPDRVQLHMEECRHRKVPCINKENGCNEMVMFKDYSKHIEKCPHVVLKCEKCGELFPKCRKDDHESECSSCKCSLEHLSDCRNNFKYCDQCHNIFTEIEIKRHVLECPFRMVSCKFRPCGYKNYVKCVEMHMLECQYRQIRCDGCGRLIHLKDHTKHRRECQEIFTCENCGNTLPRSSKQTHDRMMCLRSDCIQNHQPPVMKKQNTKKLPDLELPHTTRREQDQQIEIENQFRTDYTQTETDKMVFMVNESPSPEGHVDEPAIKGSEIPKVKPGSFLKFRVILEFIDKHEYYFKFNKHNSMF